MKRVTFDARWLRTGIGTYTWNLLIRLKIRRRIYLQVITLPQFKDQVSPFCDEVQTVNASMYSLTEQWSVPIAARGSDLLHSTHYNVPLLYPGNLVVSIHDLNHILDSTFQKSWKSRLYARPMFYLAAQKAAHVLTLSNYSKQQILRHLRVPDDKVTVTYCGVSEDFFTAPSKNVMSLMRQECGVPGSYILYVGNLKPHKNVSGLFRAFAIARRGAARACKLLVIGDDPIGTPYLRSVAAELEISDAVKFVPWVNQEVLRAAYHSAELTVLPSFQEGFGLPVLESMASATPVVCSEVASLPEVGGEAVEYCDPGDVYSIAAAIEKVLTVPGLRWRMRNLGLERARQFTWDACVDKVLSVYEQVVPS